MCNLYATISRLTFRKSRSQSKIEGGGVGERLKPAVLKTVRLERVSGVRIPPPPPHAKCTVRRHPLQNVPETYFTPWGQKGCLKAAESFAQDRCNRDRSP